MTTTSEQTRIAELENALRQARDAIMKAAEDTLWCEDSPAETVVDRIDAVLGGEAETAELFPDLPSPPVSGEAVELLRLILPLAKGYAATHSVGQNMAFIERAESLLTNEPVGVTISRELAEDIHEALEDLGACPDDECTQCKHVLPRLSAAITGEKG